MSLPTHLRAALAVSLSLPLSLGAQPEAGDPIEIGFTFAGWAMIDGIVDEAWKEVLQYPIENILPIDRGEAGGPETESAWWKSMFDEENLYLLVSVPDDILVASVDGSTDKADSVDVFLSGTYTRTFSPAWNISVYGFNDYHIRFGIGEAAGERPEITAGYHSSPFWEPESGVAETEGVKYACVAVDGGYLMEIQIALELLYIEAPFDFRDWPLAPQYLHSWVDESNFNDYRKIGFEIGVTNNNAEDSSPEQRLFWAGHENIYPDAPGSNLGTAWLHPGTWGTLVFAESDIVTFRPGYYDDRVLHWIYYFGYGWAVWYANDFSSNWGYIYLNNPYKPWGYSYENDPYRPDRTGWRYHSEHGWIYFSRGSVTSEALIYSPTLGWLVASQAYGEGQYYRFATASFEPWVP